MNFTFSRVFRSSRVLSGASQRVHPISAHKHGHGVRHLLSMEGLLRCSANDVPLTPISFIERAAVVYRDRTSVVYGNLKFTWEETRNRCRRLASALTQLGISRGDVVNLSVPSACPEILSVITYIRSSQSGVPTQNYP
ncbi:hypothetical protein Sjap_009750 [Stephania japonica]|uniref:AMP-dependent synthetase/ligase domain-containing protein n=1 Tax=Stephania japonica TaxID=461633 RepID=A0AAP0P3L9_9MAGN